MTSTSIYELKKTRDKLWSVLDEILAEKAPILEKEKGVRDEIRLIQQKIYRLEMTPKLNELEGKNKAGALSDREKEKLAILREELSG